MTRRRWTHLSTLATFCALWTSGLAATQKMAQPKAPVKTSAVAQKTDGGRHCLWRVTNASAPFYLVGSVHALRQSDYPLAPAITNAIQQSQQFYFEYDPKLDATLGQKLVAAAKYPDGVQIKGRIRPETFNYLMKITHSGWSTWQHLKPWAIAMFLLDHPGYERVSYAYGLDNYIEAKARMRGRPMHGLESVDEHVAVLGGMSEVESEIFLLEALVFADQGPARFREGIAAWKTGDTNRLFALEMPEIKEAPGLNPRFIDVRNARWIPKIEAAIKSGQPTMIVAGAMHFSGPHSVLTMLRARGYNIEQL